MHRKIARPLRVVKNQRQMDESPFLDQSRQVAWGGDLSLRALDGNLPSGSGADENIVARIGNVAAGVLGQFRNVGQPPYQCMGVQQEALHQSPPGKIFDCSIASMSS